MHYITTGKAKYPALFPFIHWVFIIILSTGLTTYGQQVQKPNSAADTDPYILDSYNVHWKTPGLGSAESMPLGNGDIALNVWTVADGDIYFYISKTDSWGVADEKSDEWIKAGGVLMKLGLIHLSFSPKPNISSINKHTKKDFLQVLKLATGEIIINEGEGTDDQQRSVRIWVDADHPVIRVELNSKEKVFTDISLIDWRKEDSILNRPGSIVWYHQNPQNADPHLKTVLFGARIIAKGMLSKDLSTLHSITAAKTKLISIFPLTQKQGTVKQWEQNLNIGIQKIQNIPLEQTRLSHRKWWADFWKRSWIFIHGDEEAEDITRGYILQRYITACAGRGSYPIKFNGSLFTVDNPKVAKGSTQIKEDPDYRQWGGQYWFQNTRAMYWPRLMAGDFDIMRPLFAMYLNMLKQNASEVKQYYHHGGAYFAETAPFWGGLKYMGSEVPENWTGHYFTPILELSKMMLDYYAYTGEWNFAKDTLVPIANAGIEFFDKHFGRDNNGKILLDPDNSIEMFWKVHDPAPDIAGLRSVLQGLIDLPRGLVDPSTLNKWKKLQMQLPELPIDSAGGQKRLLPYTGVQSAKGHNLENPELYAVYPFRLFGLGMPDLDLAIHSFLVRNYKDMGCWVQDPVQAAMLGLTDVAKQYVHYNFTRKDPDLKFPAFWAAGHDYMPDQDNGGNAENALQQMLMQTDGKKIRLLPAWPLNWDVHFKLHAPYNTTIEARVEKGHLSILQVVPASRKGDIIFSKEPSM